jgi:hypothetical protein
MFTLPPETPPPMPRAYHVQYGLARQVGRFLAVSEFERGQPVVLATRRGTELGMVVAEAGALDASADRAEILRPAGPDDLARARRAEAERHRRFDACLRVFSEGTWPIEPIDVEPLLDDDRAVLHYLGPHRLDLAGLRAALRVACGLDLVFEPVGKDLPDEPEPEPEPDDHGCGSCGSDGGCGSGGGCSGCSVSKLVSARRRAKSHA